MNTEYTVAEVRLTYKRKASYLGEGELRRADALRIIPSIFRYILLTQYVYI